MSSFFHFNEIIQLFFLKVNNCMHNSLLKITITFDSLTDSLGCNGVVLIIPCRSTNWLIKNSQWLFTPLNIYNLVVFFMCLTMVCFGNITLLVYVLLLIVTIWLSFSLKWECFKYITWKTEHN